MLHMLSDEADYFSASSDVVVPPNDGQKVKVENLLDELQNKEIDKRVDSKEL